MRILFLSIFFAFLYLNKCFCLIKQHRTKEEKIETYNNFSDGFQCLQFTISINYEEPNEVKKLLQTRGKGMRSPRYSSLSKALADYVRKEHYCLTWTKRKTVLCETSPRFKIFFSHYCTNWRFCVGWWSFLGHNSLMGRLSLKHFNINYFNQILR